MCASLEEMKTEAVERMKMLGIFYPTIRDFEENGKLSQSEPPFGACYWVEGDQLERVKQFERENHCLVYFIIHDWSNLGETENYLYVSNYPDEWEYDRADMRDGYCFAYVHNNSCPNCSESGAIGVTRTSAAGLKRIW